MSITAQPQASIYETTIENASLEAALEERERLKARAGNARKAYREVDDRAKTLADELDLGDGAPVRCGRFVLTRRSVKGRSVSFETEPTSRLTISVIPDLA